MHQSPCERASVRLYNDSDANERKRVLVTTTVAQHVFAGVASPSYPTTNSLLHSTASHWASTRLSSLKEDCHGRGRCIGTV